VNRSRQRSPNLSAWDRILAGLLALLLRPPRLFRSAIVLKPSTLLALHKAMSKQKHRMLFSPDRRRKPGTIARIPHEKGERPIRQCHDQSPISARFDGSPTADPCIRPQWLPDTLEDSGSLRHPVNL
jgi:hypothetical protein